MKQVMVVAHSFDCLAGHVSITGRGEGTSVRIALGRAVDAVFDDLRLKHKRISSCRLTVTVAEATHSTSAASKPGLPVDAESREGE